MPPCSFRYPQTPSASPRSPRAPQAPPAAPHRRPRVPGGPVKFPRPLCPRPPCSPRIHPEVPPALLLDGAVSFPPGGVTRASCPLQAARRIGPRPWASLGLRRGGTKRPLPPGTGASEALRAQCSATGSPEPEPMAAVGGWGMGGPVAGAERGVGMETAAGRGQSVRQRLGGGEACSDLVQAAARLRLVARSWGVSVLARWERSQIGEKTVLGSKEFSPSGRRDLPGAPREVPPT